MIKRQLVQLGALFFICAVALPAYADQRQSATALMTPSNQAMQNDMSLNPALFWIMDGEALWGDRRNPAGKACADCHQDVKQSMKSVAATFPKRVNGKLLNLEGQINQCQTSRQKATGRTSATPDASPPICPQDAGSKYCLPQTAQGRKRLQ